MRRVRMFLLVVVIVLAALWFAGERGLVTFPYPPIRPWLRENVTITVVRSQGQCVVIDAPARLITKAGRTVRWKIRAREDECAAHDVIVQFEGDDPTGGAKKQTKATDGSEFTATIATTAKPEKLYIYQILLASQSVIMGRGTLIACPYWPCGARTPYAGDATITTDPGGPVIPTTTLTPGTINPPPTIAPGTTIPATPAPGSTPRLHP
jgi:hypothetical protein